MRLTKRLLDMPAAQPTPQASAGDASVAYEPSTDGPFAAFRSSSKGRRVQEQLDGRLSQLQDTLLSSPSERDDASFARLQVFRERLQQPSPGDAHVDLIFSEGKRALDVLCDAATDPTLPRAAVSTAIRNLSEGLDVCAPGATSHLIAAAEAVSNPGPAGHARRVLSDMIDQTLLEFVRRQHGLEQGFVNSEVHYVAAYRNVLADDFGLRRQDDPYIPRTTRSEEAIGAMRQFVGKYVNAESIVRTLAESCLSEVQARYAARRGKPLDEEAAWDVHEDFLANMQVPLAQRFGKIDSSVLVNDRNGGGTEDEPHSLLEDPAPLMRSIAKNLQQAGLLEKERFETVGSSEHDGTSIKRIAEGAYYVKTRLSSGSAYGPVFPQHIPPTGATADLVQAAARNVRSEQEWRDIPDASAAAVARANPRFALSTLVPQALADGNENRLLEMIAGSRVHYEVDSNGNTLAHLAARSGQLRVLNALLKLNPPGLLETNHQGDTLLSLALAHGKIAAFDILVDELPRQHLEKKDGSGETILHRAARAGNAEAVAILLRSNAELNVASVNGVTPLMSAALGGNLETAQLLCDVMSTSDIQAKDRSGRPALMWAAEAGHADIVRALAPRSELDGRERTGLRALDLAAHRNDLDSVRELLAHGATAGSGRRSAVKNASQAMVAAAGHGNVEMIQLLARAGASLDQDSSTLYPLSPLIRAIAAGKPAAAVKLVELGAKTNVTDRARNTALYLAVVNRMAPSEILALARAEPRVINFSDHKHAETAIMAARRLGMPDVAKALEEEAARSGAPVKRYKWENKDEAGMAGVVKFK